jgi:alpha-tubulin suppressor-like RCC1 family protein
MLGINSRPPFYTSSPQQVGALTNWDLVAVGSNHCIAVKTDGTLWSWGGNASGQLGLGNTTVYSSPKQVGALTSWSKIGLRGIVSFAIKTDGTLWSWGSNTPYGQLGIGNTTNYSSPKQVGALTNWATIGNGSGSGNPFSIFAVKTDGTLWSWGSNTSGELGLGNTTNYSSPKQVGALNNWSKVGPGEFHCLAIKTDGTLWSWGAQNYGELGLGNITDYSSPKQIGALTTWATVSAASFTSFGIKTS